MNQKQAVCYVLYTAENASAMCSTHWFVQQVGGLLTDLWRGRCFESVRRDVIDLS